MQTAETFDRLINDALDEREALYGHPVFENHHLRRMRITELVKGYLAGKRYPAERLVGVVDRAVDMKLQMYLTGEIPPAMMNAYYYDRINRVPSGAGPTSAKLVLLSLHQDVITKSRILWIASWGSCTSSKPAQRTSRGPPNVQRRGPFSRCAALRHSGGG